MTTQLDEFHAHEVLHTITVVLNLIGNELVEHQFSQTHGDVREALEASQRELSRAYQPIRFGRNDEVIALLARAAGVKTVDGGQQ